MKRIHQCIPRGMALAFAATVLLFLASHAGASGASPAQEVLKVQQISLPMSETDLAGAIGGKPAYCDKALVSCTDGCSNWGWLGGIFTSGCNTGCLYSYSQCGGA